MNLRLARFWSVIRLNRSYNVTYASQPPKDTIYQLNTRTIDSLRKVGIQSNIP